MNEYLVRFDYSAALISFMWALIGVAVLLEKSANTIVGLIVLLLFYGWVVGSPKKEEGVKS